MAETAAAPVAGRSRRRDLDSDSNMTDLPSGRASCVGEQVNARGTTGQAALRPAAVFPHSRSGHRHRVDLLLERRKRLVVALAHWQRLGVAQRVGERLARAVEVAAALE